MEREAPRLRGGGQEGRRGGVTVRAGAGRGGAARRSAATTRRPLNTVVERPSAAESRRAVPERTSAASGRKRESPPESEPGPSGKAAIAKQSHRPGSGSARALPHPSAVAARRPTGGAAVSARPSAPRSAPASLAFGLDIGGSRPARRYSSLTPARPRPQKKRGASAPPSKRARTASPPSLGRSRLLRARQLPRARAPGGSAKKTASLLLQSPGATLPSSPPVANLDLFQPSLPLPRQPEKHRNHAVTRGKKNTRQTTSPETSTTHGADSAARRIAAATAARPPGRSANLRISSVTEPDSSTVMN